MRRVVTLITTQPQQELTAHAGNQVVVTVTVEVMAQNAQPYNVLLDDQPCQIDIVDEAGLELRKVQIY